MKFLKPFLFLPFLLSVAQAGGLHGHGHKGPQQDADPAVRAWKERYLSGDRSAAKAAGIEIVEKVVGKIPVLVCRPASGSNHPLVIVSHGFSGSKETVAAQLEIDRLAQKGWYVVALDNRGHGDRRASLVTEGGVVSLLRIRALIRDTADDIPRLVDEFARAPEVDASRIAMVGVSMGGFATWRALSIDPRIKFGAPLIASPYWEDIPGRIPFALSEVAEAQFLAARENPALAPETFAGKRILALLGADDPHLDPNKARAFVEGLANSDPKERNGQVAKVYPGVAHTVTAEMRATLLAWLDEVLNGAQPASDSVPSTEGDLPPRNAVARCASLVVPGKLEDVFPLLCPKREEEWIPDWKAETVYAPTGVAGEDAIFDVVSSSSGVRGLWAVTLYEPPHRVEYTSFGDDGTVMRLKLLAESVPQGTRVAFVRTIVAVEPRGREKLARWSEKEFQETVERLRSLLETYLQSQGRRKQADR